MLQGVSRHSTKDRASRVRLFCANHFALVSRPFRVNLCVCALFYQARHELKSLKVYFPHPPKPGLPIDLIRLLFFLRRRREPPHQKEVPHCVFQMACWSSSTVLTNLSGVHGSCGSGEWWSSLGRTVVRCSTGTEVDHEALDPGSLRQLDPHLHHWRPTNQPRTFKSNLGLCAQPRALKKIAHPQQLQHPVHHVAVATHDTTGRQEATDPA